MNAIDNRRKQVIRQTESNIRELGKMWETAVASGDEAAEARYSRMLGEQQAKLRRFDPTNKLV